MWHLFLIFSYISLKLVYFADTSFNTMFHFGCKICIIPKLEVYNKIFLLMCTENCSDKIAEYGQ